MDGFYYFYSKCDIEALHINNIKINILKYCYHKIEIILEIAIMCQKPII